MNIEIFASMPLNYVDYGVITVIVISAFLALLRGFVGSFLSFTGWVASIYLTYNTYPYVNEIFANKINSPLLGMLIGYAALLICYLIAFGLFNMIALHFTKPLMAGFLDKLLGLAFGVVRGLVIVSFIFFVTNTMILALNGTISQDEIINSKEELPIWMQKAAMLEVLQEGQATLLNFIPEDSFQSIQDVVEMITDKDIKERYLRKITNKLEDSLSPTYHEEIDSKLSEIATNYTHVELENKRLQMLWEAYERDAKHSGNITDNERKFLDSYLKAKDSQSTSMLSKGR